MNSISHLMEKIKARGGRLTLSRLAILNYLENNNTHPDVETVYIHLKKNHPSLSLSTIYSTLDLLEEMGEINKIIFTKNKTYYDPITTPHLHLFCTECKSVYDLECNLDEKKLYLENEHQLNSFHGYFSGICKNCKN